MQIHELNEMSGAPARSDVLAVDTGTATEKLTVLNLMKGILNAGDTSPIAAYPTTGGLFRVAGAITGKPSAASNYGALAIFDCGTYIMHIWLDHNSKLFYGYTSGGTIAAPSAWKQVYTPDNGALAIENGGSGDTGLTTQQTVTYTGADARITAVTGYFRTWGPICMLYIAINANCSGTAFTPGSNIDLTLSNVPGPLYTLSTATYNGANAIGAKYHLSSKLLRFRNASANSITSATFEANAHFIFFTE